MKIKILIQLTALLDGTVTNEFGVPVEWIRKNNKSISNVYNRYLFAEELAIYNEEGRALQIENYREFKKIRLLKTEYLEKHNNDKVNFTYFADLDEKGRYKIIKEELNFVKYPQYVHLIGRKENKEFRYFSKK